MIDFIFLVKLFLQCYKFYALYFPFSSDIFIFSLRISFTRSELLISISVMEKPKTHMLVFDHAYQEKQHCMFISQSAVPYIFLNRNQRSFTEVMHLKCDLC